MSNTLDKKLASIAQAAVSANQKKRDSRGSLSKGIDIATNKSHTTEDRKVAAAAIREWQSKTWTPKVEAKLKQELKARAPHLKPGTKAYNDTYQNLFNTNLKSLEQSKTKAYQGLGVVRKQGQTQRQLDNDYSQKESIRNDTVGATSAAMTARDTGEAVLGALGSGASRTLRYPLQLAADVGENDDGGIFDRGAKALERHEDSLQQVYPAYSDIQQNGNFGQKLALSAVEQVPMLAASLGGAGVAAKGAQLAGAGAKTSAAVAYGSAAGMMYPQAYGDGNDSTKDELAAATAEQLAKAPRSKELYKGHFDDNVKAGMSEEEAQLKARDQTISSIAEESGHTIGIATLALSMIAPGVGSFTANNVAGGAVSKLGQKTFNRLAVKADGGKVAKYAIPTAIGTGIVGLNIAEEGLQEGFTDYTAQQAAVDVGVKEGIDTEQFKESVLMGAALGGLMGGGTYVATRNSKLKQAQDDLVTAQQAYAEVAGQIPQLQDQIRAVSPRSAEGQALAAQVQERKAALDAMAAEAEKVGIPRTSLARRAPRIEPTNSTANEFDGQVDGATEINEQDFEAALNPNSTPAPQAAPVVPDVQMSEQELDAQDAQIAELIAEQQAIDEAIEDGSSEKPVEQSIAESQAWYDNKRGEGKQGLAGVVSRAAATEQDTAFAQQQETIKGTTASINSYIAGERAKQQQIDDEIAQAAQDAKTEKEKQAAAGLTRQREIDRAQENELLDRREAMAQPYESESFDTTLIGADGAPFNFARFWDNNMPAAAKAKAIADAFGGEVDQNLAKADWSNLPEGVQKELHQWVGSQLEGLRQSREGNNQPTTTPTTPTAQQPEQSAPTAGGLTMPVQQPVADKAMQLTDDNPTINIPASAQEKGVAPTQSKAETQVLKGDTISEVDAISDKSPESNSTTTLYKSKPAANAAIKKQKLDPSSVTVEQVEGGFKIIPSTSTDNNAAIGRDGKAKWFGSNDKAQAFIRKKGLADTHEVVSAGKSRFEIQPKQAAPQSNVSKSEMVAASPIKPPQSPVVKSETVSESQDNSERKLVTGDRVTAKNNKEYEITNVEFNSSGGVKSVSTLLIPDPQSSIADKAFSPQKRSIAEFNSMFGSRVGDFGAPSTPTGEQPTPAKRAEAKKDNTKKTQNDVTAEPKSRFADNKLFTEDKVAAARARLKSKLTQVNSGLDPEILMDGMTLAGAYIESGVRKFGDYAKMMIEDVGVEVKPYLLSFWEGTRHYPGLDTAGMTNPEESKREFEALNAEPEQASAPAKSKHRETIKSNGDINKFIGENEEGLPIYENDEGIRVISHNNGMVLEKEKYTVAPTDSGLQAQLSERSDKFKTTDELSENNNDTGTSNQNNQSRTDRGLSDADQADAEIRNAGRGEAESTSDVSNLDGRSAGSDTIASDGNARSASASQRADAINSDSRADSNQSSDGATEAADATPTVSAKNHVITPADSTDKLSWQKVAERNVSIIELVKQLDNEGRQATAAEQAVLAQYAGWGASEVANGIFPNPDTGKYKSDSWQVLGEKLKSLLTESEYDTARRTTQYAHYTPPVLVEGIYKALSNFGFKGGQVLEPASGIGVFNGLMPKALADSSTYVGLELDPITGRIAQHLYPQSSMKIDDYIKAKLPDNHFDVAVGNPPFAGISVSYKGAGKDGKKQSMQLHDFFFAKTLDKLKPGGVMVFVTSKGTMDKKGSAVRELLAEQADLVGAIRLPQTAFKENAGTEVVTDIIFLRKRLENEKSNQTAWTQTKSITASGKPTAINEYFVNNPDMVLGEHAITSGRFGDTYTVTPNKGDFASQVNQAIDKLPKDVFTPGRGSQAEFIAGASIDYGVQNKEGGIYLKDGELMRVVDGRGLSLTQRYGTNGKPIKLTPKDKAFLADYIGVRDALKQAQLDQLTDRAEWEDSLASLNDVYDSFVKNHGPLMAHTVSERENDDGSVTVTKRFKNKQRLFLDVEGVLASALENVIDDGKGTVVKGSFFEGRSLRKPKAPTITSTQDALVYTLDEKGVLDIDRIAQVTNQSREQVITELGDQIYSDPTTNQWDLAETYLSGNVVEKLATAKAAAKNNSTYNRNVKALEAVQPAPIAPNDISSNMGAAWIPGSAIKEFSEEVLGAKIDAEYSSAVGLWDVSGNSRSSDYATADRSTVQLVESILNSRKISITRKSADGSTFTDSVATELANEVARKIKTEFKKWLWSDDTRTQELADYYNKTYNNIVPPTFNGDHLTLSGMSNKIQLRAPQKRGIYRVIRQGDVYLNHAVGAGKAQPLDAKILTPGGWVLMGDIQAGDQIITQSGKPTTVTNVFPQGEKEIFKVTFSDGSTTECCNEHLWLTHTYKERMAAQKSKKLGKDWASGKPKVRQLSEIRETLVAPHLGAKNHSIPMVSNVQFPSQPTLLDPYLMGVLLGDGHTGKKAVSISGIDKEIIDNIVLPAGTAIRENLNNGRCPSWHLIGTEWRNNPVLTACRELGISGKLAHEKRVPSSYLFNDTDTRLAVLRGLMDADGTVNKKGTSVTFATSSKSLASDVTFLVQSLGGIAQTTTKQPTYVYAGEKKNGRESFVITIALPPKTNPFLIKRKADKVVPKTKYVPVRYVVSVESVGKKQAQCISVADESRLYVTDDFIVTHNTFTMIAAAMEEKRLGLINKPMFVVPNHMLDQFSQEFLMLYPAANIMVADEQNFHTHNRKQFVAQAALNTPDAIIITHSGFERIGVKPDTKKEFLEKKIEEWKEALESTKARDGDNRISVKQLERNIESLERNLDDILSAKEKDGAVFFEDMGVDKLYIDEAHEFRKLNFVTKMGNIKGIDPAGSQKAMDLDLKLQLIRKGNPNRAFVGASGTPVTNTMGELYTIQRYFQPDQLEQDGLHHFDSWANQFGEVVEGLEQNAAGNYEVVPRFAKFVNVPELMSRVRSFMDVLTSQDLGDFVTRPNVKTGGREIVAIPTPDGFSEYQQTLSARIDAIRKRSGKPEKGDDIILSVIGDGRFSAIDMRFVDPTLPSDPNSKLNTVIRDMAEAYHATADNEYVTDGAVDDLNGGALMMFTDIGLGEQSAASRGFDMKAWINSELIRLGVKPEDIAFMRDNKTHAKKGKLFDDMRQGRKRIMIGGKDMETGVNAQKRLTHLFHLDAPWYPASVEQREGRIIRQGNQNKEVVIKAYATKGSYDSTMWSMVARKARFIEQAMRGDATVRSMDDVSEASAFEQASALSSGDPRSIQLAGLRQDVERLNRQLSGFQNEKFGNQNKARDSRRTQARAERELNDINKLLPSHKNIETGDVIGKVGSKAFDNRSDYGQAIIDAYNKRAENFDTGEHVLGSAAGYDVVYNGVTMSGGNFYADANINIPKADDAALFDTDNVKDARPDGLATRIINRVNKLADYKDKVQKVIEQSKTDAENYERRANQSFDAQTELEEKSSQLKELEDTLSSEAEALKQDSNPNNLTDADRVPGADSDRPTLDDMPKYSKTNPAKGATGTTAKQVISTLQDRFGKEVVSALIKSGKLRVRSLNDFVDSDGRLLIPDDAEGFYHDSNVVLIADNLTPETVVATFLHELGGHAGIQGMMSESAYMQMMEQFDALVESGNKYAVKAKERAEATTNSESEARDEYIPYLITEYAQATERGGPLAVIKRFVNRVMAGVRAWVRDHTGVPLKMTPNDMVQLAERMVKRLADQSASDMTIAGVENMPASEAQFSRRYSTLGTDGKPMTAQEIAQHRLSVAQAALMSTKFYTGLLFRRHLATPQHVALLYPIFKKFTDKVQARIAYENNEAGLVQSLLPEIWDTRLIYGKKKKAMERVSKAIFDGTMADQVWTDSELETKFNLTPEDISFYRRARQAIDTSVLNMTVDTLSSLAKGTKLVNIETVGRLKLAGLTPVGHNLALQKHMTDELEKLAKGGLITPKAEARMQKQLDDVFDVMSAVAGKYDKLVADGYAPLMRFGHYAVEVRDKNTNELDLFELYETKGQQNKAIKELKEKYDKDQFTVGTGTLNPEGFKQFKNKGLSPETVQLFATELGLDKDGAHQAYLKIAVSDRSALKRLIHRKKVPGYSEDMPRVLSSFVMSNARYSGRSLYNSEIERSIQSIEDGNLQNEAQKVFENMENPQEEFAQQRSLMFFYFMGFSPAFFVLNLTQPFTQTIPKLTAYVGAGKGHAYMTQALYHVGKHIGRSTIELGKKIVGMPTPNWKGFEDNLPAWVDKEDYLRMSREGHLDPQNIYMIKGLERGKGGVASGVWGNIQAGAGWFAEASESINRRSTMIAAFKVAKDLGDAKLKAKGFDSKYDFAVSVVQQTQGIYNKANRSGLARGNGKLGQYGPLILVFKQFTINYTEQMIRHAKDAKGGDMNEAKALAVAMMWQFAFAGMLGLPFADDLRDIFEGIAYRVFGKAFNLPDFLQEQLGKSAADTLMYGYGSEKSRIDFHGRSSLGNIIPGTDVIRPGPTDWAEVLGAASGFYESFFSAASMAAEGNYKDAVITASPRVVRDFASGTEIAMTGSYRNTKGDKIMDLDGTDAFIKMMQFNPSNNARLGRDRSNAYDMKNTLKAKTDYFSKHLAEAIYQDDDEKVDKLYNEMDRWNDRNADHFNVDIDKIEKSAEKRVERKDFGSAERQNVQDSLAERQEELAGT